MDQTCIEQIISEDYVDLLLELNSNFKETFTSPDICYTNLSYGFSIAHVPVSMIPNTFLHDNGYGIIPHCFGLLDEESVNISGVTKLRNIPGFNLLGQDVLIGIVDTGIEYTHPAFLNEAGGSKIVSIWDQTIQGSPPDKFSFGTEYTQSQINEALKNSDPLSIVPSKDEIGHGTAMAGIAAGSISEKDNFAGVVPDSEIAVVKLKPAKTYVRNFWAIPENSVCYQESDIILAFEYLHNVATTLKRPISICLGIGTSQGSHDGTDILSRYLSLLSVHTGVAIVIAAGNEGNRGHHFFGEVKSNNNFESVELKVGPNETGFTMELWGQSGNTFSIDILSPSGEYIPRIPASLGESREIRFLFEYTIINLDYFLVESQSGSELILLRFRNPTEGIWRFRIYAAQTNNSRFHIWLPINGFINDQTFFSNPNPETTLTTPANTIRTIVTTAYDYSNQSLYLYTSRGFTREGNISPDFTAPGVNLISPTLNKGYSKSSGTSLAAAHTAGISAILLEWGIVKGNYLLLDSMQISVLLKRGAIRLPNQTYPDPAWGYGILNLYNTFLSLRGEY